MNRNKVGQIVELLKSAYGNPRWQPTHDPVGELVRTILSQNTSDVNSVPAYKRLRGAFNTWEELAKADPSRIESVIKQSGLGNIKAGRIKLALAEIKSKRGGINLDFLDGLPLEVAKQWLKDLPGVGDKTAACVLLFAMGRPALPVDTHIFRVTKRLGLLEEDATLKEAHEALGKLVPQVQVYAFHVLTIQHGRKTCAARQPKCAICALRRICPSYEKFVGNKAID